MNKSTKNRVYRNSLRRRITGTYISVYIIMCLFLLALLFISFNYYYVESLNKATRNIGIEIKFLERTNGDIEYLVSDEFSEILNDIKAEFFASEISIYQNDAYKDNSQILINTTKQKGTVFLKDKRLHQDAVSVMFPLMKDIERGKFDDSTTIITSSDKSLTICVTYPLDRRISDWTFMLRMTLVSMFAGLVLFILVGLFRSKIMLEPIHEISRVAKQINGENLNLRISEDKAKYELKELAATINSMMDRIQLSYDKQKRFVSDVSHELRTPIAVISGYGSMLKRWGKQDEVVLDESIDAIMSESKNMKELVEKLLFLARHDNETGKFDFVELNLSELCDDVVKKAVLINDDFTVNVKIKDDIYASVDELRIRQSFRILIDNALKYSGDSRTLDIEFYDDRKNIYFSVRDYGVGISKKDLPFVFDRFFRSDESRTKNTGGYGLGLSICKIIILGHGGKINLKSKLGKGSTFTAILPKIK